MNIMYVFDDRQKQDHEHTAYIYDDNFEIVNVIVGKVNWGYTEEILMDECAERYAPRDQSLDRLADFVAEGNARDAQGDPDYRYYESNDRASEDQQAQSVAAHYGGIAIRTTDKTALVDAGCEQKRWMWVEDHGGASLEESYSIEWTKGGRLLTVICDNYYLINAKTPE